MAQASSIVDARLLSALRADAAGEAEGALEQLYRHHGGALFSFLTHCTGDASVAQQVVEEVFVRLWKEPHSFDPSQRSLRFHLTREAYRRYKSLPSAAPALAERVEHCLSSSWLRLSSDERLVIGLAHFGEMRTEQVAEVLGVTKETVESTISQGLQRLAGAGEVRWGSSG